MSYSNARNPVNQYNKIGVQSKVEEASPHRLIQLLFEGALEKIALAKGNIQQGNTPEKAALISWAIAIIQGLQSSLDMNVGGEIAENLEALYEYMQKQLLKANLHNDVSLLDEVTKLLTTIKEGWDAIPEEYRNPSLQNQQSEAAVNHTSDETK